MEQFKKELENKTEELACLSAEGHVQEKERNWALMKISPGDDSCLGKPGPFGNWSQNLKPAARPKLNWTDLKPLAENSLAQLPAEELDPGEI